MRGEAKLGKIRGNIQPIDSARRELSANSTQIDNFVGQWKLKHALNGTTNGKDLVEITLPTDGEVMMDIHARKDEKKIEGSSPSTGENITEYGILVFVKNGNLLFCSVEVLERNELEDKETVLVESYYPFSTGIPTPSPYAQVEKYTQRSLGILEKIVVIHNGDLIMSSNYTRMTFSRM